MDRYRKILIPVGLSLCLLFGTSPSVHAQQVTPETKRTVNRYWLSAAAVVEFADIERQQGRTLSDWIQRSKAREELPNRRGHYLLYRHRSPEDSSEITYWFGPFEQTESVVRGLESLRQATAALRGVDPVVYSTARAVRIFAPADDSIERLTDADPGAIELAWLLEQAQQLETIDLVDQRLAELEGVGGQSLPDVRSRVEGLACSVVELELESGSAGDATISGELFDGREILVGPVADRAREELALWAASARNSDLDPDDLLTGPVGTNDLVRLRQGLGEALRSAGCSAADADQKLAYFSELTRSAGAREVSVTELRTALQATGTDLIHLAAARSGAKERGTRAIPADEFQRAAELVVASSGGDIPESVRMFFPGGGSTSVGSNGAGRIPSRLILGPAGERSASSLAPTLGDRRPAGDKGVSERLLTGRRREERSIADVESAITQSLPPSIARGVLKKAKEKGFKNSRELLDTAGDASASIGLPLGAVLVVAPEATRGGVSLPNALEHGLNARGADAFQASLQTAAERELLRAIATKLGRTPGSMASGIAAKDVDLVHGLLNDVRGRASTTVENPRPEHGASASGERAPEMAAAGQSLTSGDLQRLVRDAARGILNPGPHGEGSGAIESGKAASVSSGGVRTGDQEPSPAVRRGSSSESNTPGLGMNAQEVAEHLGRLDRLLNAIGDSRTAITRGSGGSRDSSKSPSQQGDVGGTSRPGGGNSGGGTGGGDERIELRRKR